MYQQRFLRSILLLIFVFCVQGSLDAQTPAGPKKIPWNLTVVVMDGVDQREKAEIPVEEAVRFIEARTKFVFNVKYLKTSVPHKYTSFKSDPKKRATPDNMVHYMLGWDVPKSVVSSLPASTSYLFFYKLFDRKPAQAGSSLGLEHGLMIEGKLRPWATVPTDLWFYQNIPKNGFDSWAAQIVAHELINTIQGKIEARPYRCKPLTAMPGTIASVYEAERLTKLTNVCYSRLGNNAD